MAKELALLCNGQSFHETEEDQWPDCVKDLKPGREFSALTVFRALRADALYRAQALSEDGTTAIVDSYYDKLTYFYLGKPGMEWLLPSNDPYFATAKQMMELDVELLPDVDCIILLDVSFPDWVRFLETRNRSRDNLDGFVESYERYRKYIKEAVEQLCQRRGIRCIQYTTHNTSPEIEAAKLYDILIKQQILKENHATTQASLE